MTDRLRTVLIMGPMFDHCDFAPSPARRLLGYARNLPASGWRAVVLAPACRCTLADLGEPAPGEIRVGEHDVLFDPTDPEAMQAVHQVASGFQSDQAYLALRPILTASVAFRLWAEWSEASGAPPEELRSKMSWHLTPAYEPDGRPLAGERKAIAAAGRTGVGWYVRAHGHQAARARMLRNVIDSVILPAVDIHAAVGSHGYAPELRAGSRASTKANVPFVAELRDAVTRGWRPLYEAVEFARIARQVRSADAVVHVTREEQQRDAWWLGRRPLRRVIERGFDADEWIQIGEYHRPNPSSFTLRFLGTLYPQRHLGRSLEGLALFLRKLSQVDRGPIRFEYFGPSARAMEELMDAAPADVRDHVAIMGQVPRSEAIGLMASADVLVLPTSPGMPGGRFYEYLGSGTPILAAGEEVDPYVSDVLSRTGAGRLTVDPYDLAEVLYGWWSRWREGDLRLERNPAALERFTVERQARDLAELLDDLVCVDR